MSPQNGQARILESKVICKQPGRYIGWPTIGVFPDGELWIVFSGDRDAHVDPFGKTQYVRSTDSGATWSEPQTINRPNRAKTQGRSDCVRQLSFSVLNVLTSNDTVN